MRLWLVSLPASLPAPPTLRLVAVLDLARAASSERRDERLPRDPLALPVLVGAASCAAASLSRLARLPRLTRAPRGP